MFEPKEFLFSEENEPRKIPTQSPQEVRESKVKLDPDDFVLDESPSIHN